MPVFRSVRSRLVFYALGLVSLVQIGVFVTLDITNARLAREQVGTALGDGILATRRHIDSRSDRLLEAARVVAESAATRTAVAGRDLAALTPLLQNLGTRTGSELVLVASAERAVLVDASSKLAASTLPDPLRRLIEGAQRGERRSATMALDAQPYRVVVMPVLAPEPAGWIVAGFAIDNRLAEDLQQLTRLETSFSLREADGRRRLASSSLPVMRRAVLNMAIAGVAPRAEDVVSLDMFGEEFLTRIVPIEANSSDGTELVLQRSLAKELESFDELRAVVLFLSIGGLVLSVFGGLFIARTVTDPMAALAEAVRNAGKGGYVAPAPVAQGDEVGELANAVTGMVEGVAQRDRMRDVLGKVVSPEVAGKVLSNQIELGGEARVVTVLFCDLRRLRTFSAPYLAQNSTRDSIELMNVYLTRMSEVIEAHHGVVDKYLGSGIMALFGAPVRYDDDAGNAIAAALAMQRNLDELSSELARNGLPKLGMGIGIDTGNVIAGNMGSPNRLSYTVIGECVGFAARLEGLSARGGVEATILVSAETMRRSKRRFSARPMAISAARGGSEPDLIYAVLGDAAAEPGKSTELAIPG